MNMHSNPAQYVTPTAAEAGGFLPLAAGHPSSGAWAPNRGAHRLLHWLCAATREGCADARLASLNRHGVSDETVDRLIEGTLEPGEDLAQNLAHATAGDVLPADWSQAPGPQWADAPPVRS